MNNLENSKEDKHDQNQNNVHNFTIDNPRAQNNDND